MQRLTNPGDFLRPQDWILKAAEFLPLPPEDFAHRTSDPIRRLMHASDRPEAAVQKYLADLPPAGTISARVLFVLDARVEVPGLLAGRTGYVAGRLKDWPAVPQAELAACLGLSQPQVSNLLRAAITPPDFEDAVSAYVIYGHRLHPRLAEWARWTPLHLKALYAACPEVVGEDLSVLYPPLTLAERKACLLGAST